MSIQMKALSAVLRVKGLSRTSTAENARRQMQRIKTPASPPAAMIITHSVTRQSIAGFTSYRVTSRNQKPHTTVLYLYGGGYVSEISAPHWALIGSLADAGMQVEVPIYGLAPRYDHRDALPFLTAVYQHLTTEDPSTPVALAGDSAGGALALLLAQTVRDRCMPPPSRLILISPWLDLSLTNPEIASVERHDPWLSRVALDIAARAWSPDRALTHSSVSPLYGELGGLAPTELHIGTHDMLYPDALRFHERATAAGSDVELNTCQAGLHIYPLTPTPEGRAATRSIIESLQSD
jgi:acetyl esterase/lipase